MNTVNIASVVTSRIGTYELRDAIQKNTYRSFILAMGMICLFGLATSLLLQRKSSVTERVFNPPITDVNVFIGNEVKPLPQVKNIDKQIVNKIPVTVPITDVIGSVTPKDVVQDSRGSSDVISNQQGEGKNEGGDKTTSTGSTIANTNQNKSTVSGIVEYGNEDMFPEVEPHYDFASLQRAVVYPEILRQINKEGNVLLAVKIGTDGKPLEIRVEDSDHNMFTDAAIKAVKTQHFTPAQQNNLNVVCWIRIPVTFKMR